MAFARAPEERSGPYVRLADKIRTIRPEVAGKWFPVKQPRGLLNYQPDSKEDDKMEAVLGLFFIVMLFALFSGVGRGGAENDRPVTRIEVAPNSNARTSTATRDSGLGGLVPALILLLTVLALMFNAR